MISSSVEIFIAGVSSAGGIDRMDERDFSQTPDNKSDAGTNESESPPTQWKLYSNSERDQ